MRGSWWTFVLVGLVSSVLAGCQSVPTASLMPAALPQPAAAMPAGAPERDAPPGFVSFCMRFEDQCTSAATEPEAVKITPEIWSEIAAVNARVNGAIWPVEDERHYGRPEFWTIPTDGYGDCEDYALTKRQALAKDGLPMRALRIAVAITGRNNRHAVLTLATDEGDFVLDNETDDVLPWDKTGYRWIARQDARNDWGWVSLEGPPAPALTLATAESGIAKK